MTLTGKSKVYKHGKALTLYLSIPSQIACDSQFEIKAGDTVSIQWTNQQLLIKKIVANNEMKK